MSKQSSSERNQQLPSSMGENPLLPPPSSSSSSTLNPSSVHGSLPSFSSTFNPFSIHGSFAPSSSTSNPAASMHENLLLPSSSSTLNPSPSTRGISLLASSSTLNLGASSIHGSLLPPSSTRNNPSLEVGQSSSLQEHIRIKWTADLHRRFLNAVEFLGGERSATPRAIIDLMKEKDLTLNQVGSHLQIYRNFCFAQQQAAREAEAAFAAAAAAAQVSLTGNVGYDWSASIHYQQAWPQPCPPRLYIDPVGPMPPSIPPLMRMMNFSTTRQETIFFEELFQECRKRPIDAVGVGVGVDDEEENVRLELMPGGRAAKKPKFDLTLTLKPPANGDPDSSKPHE